MNIALKDIIYRNRQRCGLLIHRFATKTRFVPPGHPAGPDAVLVRDIEARDIRLPDSFTILSKSYSGSEIAGFSPEQAFSCSQPAGFLIRRGNFIETGPHRLLDIGKQAETRWRFLEQPFPDLDTIEHEHVILPWGSGGASYGDFLIQVLPKLARLISAVSTATDIRNAVLFLPHFYHHSWARQYLSLLGFREDQVLDGTINAYVPPHGRIMVGTGPRSNHGIAHPSDIAELLKRISAALPAPPAKKWRRLYISRKMGRTMANEADLHAGLLARDFELIQLEDLPLMDQIRLFQEASIIAGPHGAGHANIMWSSPGTHLLEVFHPSWMHPCYALLSAMRGIHYHCLVGYNGNIRGTWTERSRHGIFEDPEISPRVFFDKIDSLISP